MANPRKFIEKIALHNQKQAEETAAFEKIMREVSAVATNVKVVTNGSEEVVANPNHQGRGRPVDGFRTRGNSVGSVGKMRPEKRSADKSPYQSGPYLSPPPPDTSWRRTHSDSALHHSVSQSSSTESLVGHLHSPGSQRRTLIDNQQNDKKRYMSTSPDKRHNNVRVPGINIFTTQHEPGVVQIPIANTTGSLPDLTNCQFSSPIHAPLDQDDLYNYSSSPYNSNSPLTTEGCSPQGSQGSQGTPSQSPSVLSPVSINSRTPPTRFSFTSSPPPDSPNQTTVVTYDIVLPNHLSVPYFMNHRLQRTCKGFTVDNSPGNSNSVENCNSNIKMQIIGQNSNVNCVTGQVNGIKMSPLQHPHVGTIMYQPIPLSPAQQQTQPSCGSVGGHTEINSLQLNIGNSQLNNINSLGTYRQSTNRPSPQSSPGLTIQYGNSSPLCSSSPQSPSSPSSSSVGSTNQHQNYQTQKDYYSNQTQTNNLQQHFEQFTMQDWNQLIQTLKESNSTAWMATQLQLDSPGSTGLEYIGGSPISNTYLTEDYNNPELTADHGYDSTSPSQSLQYPTQNYTTPNTPSSIPDIILTDFSNGDQLDNTNDFVKQLSSTNTFDADFFSTEDLDHFEHLQMLPEPNIDAVTNNDHFRM